GQTVPNRRIEAVANFISVCIILLLSRFCPKNTVSQRKICKGDATRVQTESGFLPPCFRSLQPREENWARGQCLGRRQGDVRPEDTVEVPNPGHPLSLRGMDEVPTVPPSAIASAVYGAVRCGYWSFLCRHRGWQ